MARQKNQYYICAEYISVMECSFDKSLKDFYSRLSYISEIKHWNNQLHMHLEWGSFNYNQNIGFDKVEYRDRNGNIVTLLSNMRHDNSYSACVWWGTVGDDYTDSTAEYYTQTELPYNNEYGIWDVEEPYNKAGIVDLYDLVMNKINRQNPYLHIHMKGEKGSTEEEKEYWQQQGWYKGNQFKRNPYFYGHETLHVKDSTGNYAVAYMDGIEIKLAPPVLKSVSGSIDQANKTYSFLPICEGASLTDYDIEIWQINYDGNGSNKMTYSMEARPGNAPTVVQFNKLQKGTNRVKFILYNHDAIVEQNVDFIHYEPSVKSLKLTNEGNLIDNTTTVTWESTDQGKADIYINNVKYTSVGTVTTCVIPKGKLKVGDNKVKVVVSAPAVPGITGATSVSTETSIKCTRLTPEVSDIKLSAYNTDHNITLSWTSSYQSTYKITTNLGATIASGTTAKSVVIAPGVIPSVVKSLKIEVAYNSGFDTIYANKTTSVSLTGDYPIIYNLEPDRLNKNVDSAIAVTFGLNEFITRWELTAGEYSASGTTERTVNFGANTFKKGDNVLTLKVYYVMPYNTSIVRTATRTSIFTGYGAPLAPILDENDLYSTATPTITWTSDEQEEYLLEVWDSEEETLLQSYSEANNTKAITLSTLENETEYVVKLRIKNKYGLYSEYATKRINTLFNEIVVPNFDLISASSGVQVSIFGLQDINFRSLSVFRKSINSDWVEIAYDCNVEDSITDYTCPANLELFYKLRVYDMNGAYKDTEVKTTVFKLSAYAFTDIEHHTRHMVIPGVTIEVEINRNTVHKVYSGQAKPRVFNGIVDYKTIDISMTVRASEFLETLNFFNNANYYKIFCMRDIRGEKTFAHIEINSYAPLGRNLVELSLTATEINFVEQKMYSGSGYRKLTYLNGEYLLDGAIDLSGYDDSFVPVTILE